MGNDIIKTIHRMSDGNPGAAMVLSKLAQSNNEAAMLILDINEIYGTDIYILYNDICKGDFVKMIAVIIATQLGMLDKKILKDACSRQDGSGQDLIPVDELFDKVKTHCLTLYN